MTKRTIEVFSAGCPVCDDAVRMVHDLACPSCHVRVLDMRTEEAQAKARMYGVTCVPAVAVNGTLASCCRERSVDANTLRSLGLGTPL